MSVYRTYEGRRYSPTMWAAVQEWRRLATAEGIPFRITQGGWNRGAVAASAGTHDGDAVDLSTRGLTRQQVTRLIELGRMIGLAAWFRTADVARWGTRAQGFDSEHIHAVPNGWGYPSAGAAAQARSYRAGRDGLARNLADKGPGHVSTYRTRTWADYQALDRVLSAPTPTTGGLTMSEAAAIKTDTEYIRKQLVAIAKGTYSREALNARNADTATIVQRALESHGKAMLEAFEKLGISSYDTEELKRVHAQAVADAMDGATLEITARHDDEEA